ncbi:type II toxin-antitoxin system RelE/ParE family toxin [Acuticoccus mangrovi]|uniref:Toxin n=1 Tax=Acuticoccus mangrovi TaxID=2796142 RepID=A0A934IVZ3_9HYPH|nr:type II toxin-antitoxin system RelE/ParE family toxin [Acuticoccus mangrovi]MBJ3778749.1 type II toxin-antitoxin system RelE/ParE family toxin [Acuticoccus mangrovi]
MAGYRLTEAAERDIVAIYLEGAGMFGLEQAETYHARLTHAFETLAAYPDMARLRYEIVPPVRIHPCGAHIVIYVVDERGVLIVRVRHRREDWVDDVD